MRSPNGCVQECRIVTPHHCHGPPQRRQHLRLHPRFGPPHGMLSYRRPSRSCHLQCPHQCCPRCLTHREVPHYFLQHYSPLCHPSRPLHRLYDCFGIHNHYVHLQTVDDTRSRLIALTTCPYALRIVRKRPVMTFHIMASPS